MTTPAEMNRSTDVAQRAADKLTAYRFDEPHGETPPAEAHDETAWPSMAPLPAELPSVPDFDPVLLPESLRPWVQDVTDRIQCPIEYPAVGAMVSLAAVVGRQVGIRPRQRDDWTVVPNLFGAIIGRPGQLKSPAIAETQRFINLLEARARADHAAATTAHEAEQMIAKASAKQTEQDVRKALKAGDANLARALAAEAGQAELEAPTRRRYVTSDTTVEALGQLLSSNPRGILVFRDELVGWLRDLERDGREGSRAFYLEAWNGTGRYTYDRIGRGTVEIEAACVSVLGGIQPGPLATYLRDAMKGGAGDDGLLQRIQLLVWPDTPTTWRDVDRAPDLAARESAREVFERLDTINTAAIGATTDGEIPFLRPDDAAGELFRDWRSKLENRLRSGQEHSAFEAHLAKYRSLVPSLALLIHLADKSDGGPVTEAAMLTAIGWVEFLESHALRVYLPALNPGIAGANELARRIRAGDIGDQFQARDIYRKHWSGLDRTATKDALEVLTDLGWVRSAEVPTRGRPSVIWGLHPELRGRR